MIELAHWLGSHIFHSLQSFLSLFQVVRMIETYDTTTIRASTPMFLMSRKIKAMGVKMVLSGEGADEVSSPCRLWHFHYEIGRHF